ncbi:MAG: 16S rRNA (cytosine(1402)-N(4))-methyltransferase RsmH [Acidobacteriota bacterium]|nr:16S rRNA (cytosine(1402)-N(4))-methyltransferase RsmH [Acidobacteriota bacterium]
MNKLETQTEDLHKSILLAESIEFIEPSGKKNIVDATLGLGGHTEAILSVSEKINVFGIDQDIEAIEFAKKRLDKFGSRIKILQANFSEIKQVLKEAGIEEVNGIIADLGVSSLQFDSPERGFSFRFDAPLDMRMDKNSETETAAELLAGLSEEEIANLIYEYGEERFSRRIARRIVERRKMGNPIETTFELAELVKSSVKRSRKDKIHPATKTFQALRIAVNSELEILETFLRDSVDLLNADGRLVVITFHSLEDRIVKRTMQNLSGRCFCPPKFPKCVCGAVKKIEILTRKPIIPSEQEQRENPRSRSAKLRACRKI